jgi:hypothetical protein
MNEAKISETAFSTVSLRALSNYERQEEIRTNDNVAELFIPEDKKLFFKTPESRNIRNVISLCA